MSYSRLDENISPNEYKLKIALCEEKQGFHGEVEIKLSVAEKREKIVIHSVGLGIYEVKLNGVCTNDYHVEHDQSEMHIYSSSFSAETTHTLKIKYFGRFQPSQFGLYLANDRDSSTPLYVTHFDMVLKLMKKYQIKISPSYACQLAKRAV